MKDWYRYVCRLQEIVDVDMDVKRHPMNDIRMLFFPRHGQGCWICYVQMLPVRLKNNVALHMSFKARRRKSHDR